jgi:hypothetical protein
MIRPLRKEISPHRLVSMRCIGLACAAATIFAASALPAQITINSKTGVVTNGETTISSIDRRYAQITPTKVELSKSPLDAKTRQEIYSIMQSEQGFAMRPFPRGHKGLTLNANGLLEPAGEPYLNMVTEQGLCAKPGDRVVLSDVKIEHSRIVFDLNGGPDPKHRFLRHVQIGAGPMTNPVVPDSGEQPTGARVTLAFKGEVPELTGAQVKALLSPLISFDMKTPLQAFTDTLPPKLKSAILEHHVLVGMTTDMVLYSMGQPDSKSREQEGQMPFEEWIYGKPPKDVDFVRINGNRVIRVEIAKMGESPVIYTKDEVEGLMRTDGTPLEASNQTHTQLGDAQRDPDKQAPTAPPSLRNPGEKLPQDDEKDTQNGRVGVMRPVQFPKSTQDQDTSQDTGQNAGQNTGQDKQQKPAAGQPSSASQTPAPAPGAGSQSQPAASPQPAPADQPATPQTKPNDQQQNLLAAQPSN